MDARFPAAVAQDLRVEADAAAGAATSTSTSRTSTTTSSRPITRARPGTTCRRRSRRRSTSWAFPRPRRSILAGVKAQFESEVVYGSLKEDLGKKGVIFTDTDTAVREHPDLVREYFGTIIPPDGQQVRGAELGRVVGRLVHLRAEGREDRVPAAGLFPHQRREHGPVRADADHRRRRRRGALRRRLHGPDVHAPRACTRPWSRSSSSAAPAAATRRFRTGPTTSTTW